MHYIIKTFFCTSLFLLITVSTTYSQSFSDGNWYFGTSGRGIQFSKNTGNPELITISALSPGGGAVAADPYTGTILFYTARHQVFGKE